MRKGILHRPEHSMIDSADLAPSLRCLNSFLPVRSGNENVLPGEAAFSNHLERVLKAPQVGVGVICAEGELCPCRLGLFDEGGARDLVAVIDFDGDVVVDGGNDDLVTA